MIQEIISATDAVKHLCHLLLFGIVLVFIRYDCHASANAGCKLLNSPVRNRAFRETAGENRERELICLIAL